jgi:hypothetical protein
MCRNLRLAVAFRIPVVPGVERDPADAAAVRARPRLFLRERELVDEAAVEAANEVALVRGVLFLHEKSDAGAARNLRVYTGGCALRVASTSRPICATSSSSLSKALSSRKRRQS